MAQLINSHVEAQLAKARETLGLNAAGAMSGPISRLNAFELAQRILTGTDLLSRDVQGGLMMDWVDRAERDVVSPVELEGINIVAG
jgi:hypothetical protein